jgi:hypothetical protein
VIETQAGRVVDGNFQATVPAARTAEDQAG